MIQLLVVDDQRLVCEGFKAVLEIQPDFQVVGMANNGETAISMVESLQPDLVLMDIQMPTMNGCAATQVIRDRFPDVKVLMLTTFDDEEYLEDSLKAGAVGYLLKADLPPEQLAQAIRLANEGMGLFDPKIMNRLAQNQHIWRTSNTDPAFPTLPEVSRRESEVLQLIVEGLSNREIAAKLTIAESTVKTHVKNLFEKLGCKNRAQLSNVVRTGSFSSPDR